MKQSKPQSGFTIVELLIVIIVIAILAAITVVAFRGIQERARASNVSSALNQANKKLAEHIVDNSSYPTSLSNLGIENSGDTTYQYSYNNTASPATYCITATSGTVSYKTSSTNKTPTSGGCPGHGQGGAAAITNLATNPSLETATTNWGNYIAGGAATTSRQTTGGYSGNGFYRMSWTTATTAVSGGFYPFGMGAGNMTAGTTYTASVWVRSSKDQTMRPQLTFRDSANVTVGSLNGSNVSVLANTWTRLSISGVAPANTNSALMTAYANTGGSFWQPGDTLDGDAAMLTEGSSLATYADGTSTDWAWNGTAHASFSTGPAL